MDLAFALFVTAANTAIEIAEPTIVVPMSLRSNTSRSLLCRINSLGHEGEPFGAYFRSSLISASISRDAMQNRKELFMGELTYKAQRLGSEIAGNMQQAADRASKNWHFQKEDYAQESKSGRRTFLGKVTGAAGNTA